MTARRRPIEVRELGSLRAELERQAAPPARFGLEPDELNLELGPLGRLL